MNYNLFCGAELIRHFFLALALGFVLQRSELHQGVDLGVSPEPLGKDLFCAHAEDGLGDPSGLTTEDLVFNISEHLTLPVTTIAPRC